MTEVAGSEQETIEPGDGGDRLDLGETLGRFNLQDDQLLGIGVGDVGRHVGRGVAAVGIAAVERAFAEGMEAGPLHDLPGLVGALHVRHDDAGGVGLQRPDVVAVAALGDANEGVDIVQLGGADGVLQFDPVGGHVLLAEPEGIVAREPGHLRDARIGQVHFHRRREAVFAQDPEQAAGAWFHGESAAMISATSTRREPSARLRRPAMMTTMSSTVSANGYSACPVRRKSP